MARTITELKQKADEQGALIDALVAQKTAVEEPVIEAIAAQMDVNNAKLSAALAPAAPPPA